MTGRGNGSGKTIGFGHAPDAGRYVKDADPEIIAMNWHVKGVSTPLPK